MPSAFILAVRGYPAVPLARQLEHQRYVPPNPLVLGRKLLKSPTPTTDRDRPVSRRSKPSSRTAFIGEQPNPWELLHPQDAMSRHRERESVLSHGVDYIIILPPVVGRGAITWLFLAGVGVLPKANPEPPLSGQSLRGHPPARRPTLDFPRYCRVVYPTHSTTDGSTVISRFVGTA